MDKITDLKLRINTTPRVYLSWNNTEPGRDKYDCYERITYSSGSVYYISNTGVKSSISDIHPFFQVLEERYNKAFKELKSEEKEPYLLHQAVNLLESLRFRYMDETNPYEKSDYDKIEELINYIKK